MVQMKNFSVSVCRWGHACIEAETENEAYDIAKTLDKNDFDWEPFYEDILEDAIITEI